MTSPDSVYITINGKRINIDDLPDLNLAIDKVPNKRDSAEILELRLINRGALPLEVTGVELIFKRAPFFSKKPDSHLFYKEGLTVVGVAGARGECDCDFELDPGFLRFTVSDPSTYSWTKKGVFCAEQVGVLQNKRTGVCSLAGFVTSKKFLCRIAMDMPDNQLTAIIDTEQTVLRPDSEIALEKLMLASGDSTENLLSSYAQETECDILENTRFLSQHRDSMPVEYVQIDDGWQKARGNWLESHPEKFPHGMEWLASEIKKLGFKPGIWVAPFLVSENTEVYQQHREWLLRDSHGELLTMGDNYFLDTSHPDALDWLTECFKTMKAWGYTYFKLDFMMVETCYGARYHDKNITRVQAYRRGLQAIREAVGEDSFLLGGTALLMPTVGLVNGCRISTDVTPFWSVAGHTPESPAIFNVCRNIINRGYMHKHLWLNDPDCLIVREHHNREKYKHVPSLTLAETQMLATAMIMSGGAIFLGDRMEKLSEERLEIIRKVFTLMNGASACPVDRMEGEIPRVWFRPGKGTPNKPHLLGLFNWTDSPDEIKISLAELKLDSRRDYMMSDIWPGGKSSNASEYMSTGIKISSHTCKLLSIYTEN